MRSAGHLHHECHREPESLNYSLRKVTRNRSAFPDDDSVYKIMYLAIGKASQKWTQPIRNWGLAINQFSIVFGDRANYD